MDVKLFAGQIRGRTNEPFLVWAADETDAGRYVAATLGDPEAIVEVPRADGVVVTLPRGEATARVVPSLAAEAALGAPMTPPAA